MRKRNWSRRDMLKTSGALAATALFAGPVKAAAAPPSSVTPELIDAARKEGKISYYSALELNVAERLGKAFEAKYPGISVHVERSGAERIYQRIGQEQGSGINAVDVANSTDPAHYLDWKAKDWLAPYLPEDVVKYFPADQFDADGTYATSCAWMEAIGYNSSLVMPEQAPKSYADLLDPKWQGKILSDDYRALGGGAVFFPVMLKAFGREFHEKLAAQKPVFSRDLQNSERRCARGEFPLYLPFNLQDLNNLKGLPVKAVVPAEGRPYVRFDISTLKNGPHPNASRVFMNYYLEPESQLVFANAGFNPVISGVVEKTLPEIRELLATKAMGTTDPPKQDEMLALAKEIYK
jgi:iron(III) transport system substrate-binding protein